MSLRHNSAEYRGLLVLTNFPTRLRTFAPSNESEYTPFYFDLLVIGIIAVVFLVLTSCLVGASKANQTRKRINRLQYFKEVHGKTKDTMMNESQFWQENGYSWDFVLVLKTTPSANDNENFAAMIEEQNRYSSAQSQALHKMEVTETKDPDFILKVVLRRLRHAGLEYYLCYSIQQDEIYIKIRAPLVRLQREADRLNFYLPLNANEAKMRMEKGTKLWEPVVYLDKYHGTTLRPFDYIYANYDMDKPFLELFHNDKLAPPGSAPSIKYTFSDRNRISLIYSILQARTFHRGVHLELADHARLGIMYYFCFHNTQHMDVLEDKWLRVFSFPWNLPLDDIKNYFGERIGVYFALQAHLTTWLIPAAIAGVLAWIGVAYDNNNPSAADVPYYSGLMALWATLFLESWKRREKRVAMEWGMTEYEEDEKERPGFKGESLKSPVDNSREVYFPPSKQYQRTTLSFLIITALLILALGIIAAILVLRIQLIGIPTLTIADVQLGSIIASFINTFQVIIGNMIIAYVARQLNEYENHRTDTEFEDNLVLKVFGFQFINSYGTLFYVAFGKNKLGDFDHCINYDCMHELRLTLGTLFVSKIVCSIIFSAGMPFIYRKMKERENYKGYTEKTHEISEVEKEFMLTEFHEQLGCFDDYSADVIQFGYLTMFISAFPLASLMVLVNNYIMIRINSWTLCHIYRRPIPIAAEDIGMWYHVYNFLGLCAVIVNSALVAFTSGITQNYIPETRVWIFVGMASLILSCKKVVEFLIPDIPIDVSIQLKRQKFIVSKLIDGTPDDNSWKMEDAGGGGDLDESIEPIELGMEDGAEKIDSTDYKPF